MDYIWYMDSSIYFWWNGKNPEETTEGEKEDRRSQKIITAQLVLS